MAASAVLFGAGTPLAKLLVGSDSARVGEWTDHPLFGRLAGVPRFAVMSEIDRLIAEWFPKPDAPTTTTRSAAMRHPAKPQSTG